MYDKRDDFDFDIANFPFLDGDVPRSTSYGVYISHLIGFARVSSHVADFNARNKSLTAKLLQQGHRYHKLRKTFSKFYRRHYELDSKFNVGLKILLHQGLSEPEFYGDLVYEFKKLVGRADFSDQFRKIIVCYKRIGYTGDSRYVDFAYLDNISYVEVIFHSQHFFSIYLCISAPSMSKTVNMKQRVSRGDFSCPRRILYYFSYCLCRSQKSALARASYCLLRLCIGIT